MDLSTATNSNGAASAPSNNTNMGPQQAMMSPHQQLADKLLHSRQKKEEIRRGMVSQLELEAHVLSRDALLQRLELGPQTPPSMPTGQYIDDTHRPCTLALDSLEQVCIGNR